MLTEEEVVVGAEVDVTARGRIGGGLRRCPAPAGRHTRRGTVGDADVERCRTGLTADARVDGDPTGVDIGSVGGLIGEDLDVSVVVAVGQRCFDVVTALFGRVGSVVVQRLAATALLVIAVVPVTHGEGRSTSADGGEDDEADGDDEASH